jgi:hypothetical protein
MSEKKRPSPIQPPVVNSYADNMAEVRRPPQLPRLNNFTGYLDGQTTPSRELAPFNPFSSQAHERTTERLPPIQLPPLNPPHQRPSNGPLSINNLLTSQPTSPKQQRPPSYPPQYTPRQPQYVPRHPQSQSPRSGYSTSPNEPVAVFPTSHPPPPGHYIDHPPAPNRSIARRSHPIPPVQVPLPDWRFPARAAEQEPPRVSPSIHGDRHYHSSSSDVSPSTAIAPQYPSVSIYGHPPPLNYILGIRQQPAAARACGFGERDRRVVDPPPILELKITDKATAQPQQDSGCILALHCTLLSHDGSDETEVPPAQEGMSSTRRLMGTIVASPYQAKDEHGTAGTFFVFPDLSCRSPGKYRLRFKLLRVDLSTMRPGGVSPTVASITSDVFSVFTAKDFPGMRASSALLKALRRQGLNVGVKKGSEARKGKKAKKEESSEDEDESDGEGDDGRPASHGSDGSRSSDEAATKGNAKKRGKRRKTGNR